MNVKAMIQTHPRRWLLMVALVPLVLLLFGLYLQHVVGAATAAKLTGPCWAAALPIGRLSPLWACRFWGAAPCGGAGHHVRPERSGGLLALRPRADQSPGATAHHPHRF